MCPYQVLLVDDSPAFLAAAGALLADCPGVAVAGTASSGREALERARELEPDLVLMDLRMPGMGGLEATRRLGPRPPVVLMTAYDDEEEYRAAAKAAGAVALLLKFELAPKLPPLIRALRSARDEGPAPDPIA